MNNIYLIVGRSGSGKDTTADYLCKRYGYKRVISYTTRPPRDAQDKHLFVSDTEFNQLQNIVAESHKYGNKYCATLKQVENADLYVIDFNGIDYFRKQYKGNKGVKVIGLKCAKRTAKNRMEKRGDSDNKIKDRLENDSVCFDGLDEKCDIVINAERDVKAVAKQINQYINYEEEET